MGPAVHSRPDAGFSIIELLVAIAIASLVVIGIGALFAIGSQVRDRGTDSAAVQSALIDLQALATLATSEVGLTITTPSDAGFALTPLEAGRAGFEGWEVRLTRPSPEARLELRRGSNASSVDLATFDAVSIEYLVVGSQSTDWVGGASTAGTEIRAARLRLGLGARVWRPLIWIPLAYAVRAP
jgi:prepilin-type N-terminal cleavage/methylation domain-containing protein